MFVSCVLWNWYDKVKHLYDALYQYIYLYLLIYLFFYPFIWHRFHGWASIFLSAILALRNPGDFDGSLPSLWLLKNKKSNVKTKRKGFKTVTWPKQPLLEKGRRQKKVLSIGWCKPQAGEKGVWPGKNILSKKRLFLFLLPCSRSQKNL